MSTNMVLPRRGSAAVSALALVALAAFFLIPRLNDATAKAVSEAIASLRSRFQGALGLTVSFDSLSPSILRSASFSGLSISAPGGRTLLSARRVRATYDLVAVVLGKNSQALTGLEFEDVAVDIRLPEDRAVWDRLRGFFVGGEGGSSASPKIVISGKNVSALLTLEGQGSASFDARDVSISTAKGEPAVSLDGRFSIEPARGSLGGISGPLSLTGSLSRDFAKARLSLVLAAESREFSLSTQRFELVYGEGQLALTKVKDRAPLDAEIRVDFRGGESSVSLRLDGYAPSRSLRLAGSLASLEPWLEIPYTGSIAVRAPGFDLAKLAYDLHVSGFLPAHIFPGYSPAARAFIAASGDTASVSVERASIELGSDSAEYSGSFRFSDLSPDGLFAFKVALQPGVVAEASAIRLVGNQGEYAVLADQATVGGVVFKDIALAAARKGDLTDFNLSFRPPNPDEQGSELPASGFSGEAGAEAGRTLVSCEGSLNAGQNPGLELSMDLESIDLEPLKPLLALLTDSPETAALLSSLKLGGKLFATSDLKRLSWSAPEVTVVSSAVPGAYALLSLAGAAKTIVVKHAAVYAAGYSLEGSGKLDFSEAGRLGFEASLALKDIPIGLKGAIVGQGVTVTGDYGLELSVRRVEESNYVSIKTRGLPLPIGGGLFLATVDANGRFASFKDWALSVAELDLVPTGESMAVLPKLGLTGNFWPDSAALSKLRIEDKFSAVSGSATLGYSLEPFTARVSAALSAAREQRAPGSQESYKVEASYAAGRFEGSVDLVASPLARLGKLPLTGSADGRISFKGNAADPSLDFRLALRDGRYLDQTIALGASGSYGGGLLELRDVSAAYQGQSLSGGSGRFSLADASASVAFSYAGSFADERLAFKLAATGKSRARPGASLAQMLADYGASGMVSGFSIGSIAAASWPFEASSSPSSILLVGGSSREFRLTYAPGGSFSASLRAPFPVRAEVSGLFDSKNIDLAVQGIDFDLGLLAPLMPPDLIKILSGRARGGFRAVGLINDPEISGEIDLENASLKVLGWLSDDVGPFKAPVIALGRKLSVSVPSAKAGKAAISLDFQATFDHWLPTGITATVRTLDRSLVGLDSSLLGIHAKGDAAAVVKFALQGDILALDCDVTLAKGTVVVSPEVLSQGGGSASARPSLFIAVAAKVRFGRGIEVFFPSSDFPVIAGYSDPASLLAIRYDQASEDFALKGTVALRGGEVFYIQRNFFLRNGRIVFNEGTNRFEPRVTLLAELRDRNDDGPVLITLRADNAPITSFQPRLSSVPVMTESQIAMLMGQNLFGSAGDSRLDLRKVVISGSEFIPQLNVVRAFENRVRNAFGLDMLYLRTKVLQNWLIDISGQAGAATGDTMGRYLDQTELYAGKYISDSIFAHGSTRLREDPLAGANKLVIDSELGIELDTPFGLIQWNVTPNSWENLLINDQSLSLSWKFSL